MAKKLSEFPKELSEPISWTGPSAGELAILTCDPERTIYLGVEGSEEEQEAKRADLRADIRRRQSEANSAAARTAMNKISLLKSHYNVDEKDPELWPFLLCLRLCMDFFPGFKIKYEEKRGRKKSTRDFRAQLKLIIEVERFKRKNGGTDADACTALQANGGGRHSRNNSRTLQTRLSEARRGLAGSIMNNMLGADESAGKEDELISIIAMHMLGEE